MPELNDATAGTVDAAADKVLFIDVSATPDVIKYSTLEDAVSDNAIALRTALDVDPSDGALYVADFASVQDAFDAFEISSAKTLHFPSDGSYSLTSTGWVLNDMVGKTIDGHGSTIAMTGGSAFYSLDLTGTWVNSVIKDFKFTDDGGANRFTIRWQGDVNGTTLKDCSFNGMYAAIKYQGTGFAEANMIQNNKISGTLAKGIEIAQGEYCIISNNAIYSNAGTGIECAGGNILILNNSIADNDIGIYIYGVGITNPDHGTIVGNLINHNHKVGIIMEGLLYGMVVTGNQIAANDGENLGSAPQDNSFGVYIKGGTGINMTSNMFLRNKFNCAIEGINKSVITGNVFKPNNALTTRHLYEVGGTNTSYIVDTNVFDDDLLTNTVVLATDVPGATLGTNIVV